MKKSDIMNTHTYDGVENDETRERYIRQCIKCTGTMHYTYWFMFYLECIHIFIVSKRVEQEMQSMREHVLQGINITM